MAEQEESGLFDAVAVKPRPEYRPHYSPDETRRKALAREWIAIAQRKGGALVIFQVVRGDDVCFAGMVGTQERRWPGLPTPLQLNSLGAILVRSVSKCKEGNFAASRPRGSSRDRVTASAPQTNFRATQSLTKNPDSPNGVCLGHVRVVDLVESTLVFAPPSAFRTVSRLTGTSRSKTRMFPKTGAANTSTGRKSLGRSAIATAARRLRGADGDGADSPTRMQSESVGQVEKGLISFE